MKPLFSDDERAQAVRTFLIACQHKKARIISYSDITEYLNAERVTLLIKLAKSGKDPILDFYGNKTGRYSEPYYIDGDAQVYYEWLVSAVSGTLPNVTDGDVIKQANDQLFHFIQIMQQSGTVEIDNKVQMIEPYDWQNLFSSFDSELIHIKNTVDHHDKEIVNILKSLLEFLKKNTKLLETLQKDYEGYFPKGGTP